MTCKVFREETGHLKSMTISCDWDGCEVTEDSDDIVAAGGLNEMGWFCSGGKHFCLDHAQQAREALNG